MIAGESQGLMGRQKRGRKLKMQTKRKRLRVALHRFARRLHEQQCEIERATAEIDRVIEQARGVQ